MNFNDAKLFVDETIKEGESTLYKVVSDFKVEELKFDKDSVKLIFSNDSVTINEHNINVLYKYRQQALRHIANRCKIFLVQHDFLDLKNVDIIKI